MENLPHAPQEGADQASGRPKLGKVAAGSTPWWLRLWMAKMQRASCTASRGSGAQMMTVGAHAIMLT